MKPGVTLERHKKQGDSQPSLAPAQEDSDLSNIGFKALVPLAHRQLFEEEFLASFIQSINTSNLVPALASWFSAREQRRSHSDRLMVSSISSSGALLRFSSEGLQRWGLRKACPVQRDVQPVLELVHEDVPGRRQRRRDQSQRRHCPINGLRLRGTQQSLSFGKSNAPGTLIPDKFLNL